MIYILAAVIIIIAILVLLTYLDDKRKKVNKLAEISEAWRKPTDGQRNFRQIALYQKNDDLSLPLPDTTIADLDLENVFAYIDRTSSKPGQQYLYNKLFSITDQSALAITEQQIDALPDDLDLLQQYQLQLAGLGSNNAYYIPELFKEQASLFSPLVTFYIRISGLTIIAVLTLMILSHNQLYFFAFMLMVFANIYLHYATRKKVSQYTHTLPELVKLVNVARWFSNHSDIPAGGDVDEAIQNGSKLKRALSFVSFNAAFKDPTDLVFTVVELIKTLLLLEPLMFISSINMVNKYRDSLRVLFGYVAHIDFLISIHSVREGLPFYCKPAFTAGDELQIKDLYHPLVEGCVLNSITTTANRGVLVTGSNMSGKTTFIRSIAVNALLSQTIYTSCSETYRAPWLNVHTSIRINDDMSEQKSYFQAEALSILDILNQCEVAKPTKSLVLIDEIFRGTNTIERIAAAKAVLAHLTANHNFVFVSTHDLELAELLGEDYSTYSFEEVVTDNARLVFDYRLKTGLLKKKNAIAILQSIGYPESLINDAGAVSEQLRQKYQL